MNWWRRVRPERPRRWYDAICHAMIAAMMTLIFLRADDMGPWWKAVLAVAALGNMAQANAWGIAHWRAWSRRRAAPSHT